MKKIILIMACLTGLFTISRSQVIFREPLSQRQTGYTIDAKLNTGSKTVNGIMHAFWVNKSPDIVSTVQLHLYLNAFRNDKTTFFTESSGIMAFFLKDSGYVDIHRITMDKDTDLSGFMKFISPDDGNVNDMTVLEITLPEPCKPGDTVKLNIDFTSKLPKSGPRTGYNDNFFFVGQWFPKFGVYEPAGMRYATKGEWNCHQFHSNSEFYSNHSVYDVDITVPTGYIVGSGGIVTGEQENPDSTTTYTCRAEDIVDFAWTAWPGYGIHNDGWKHVKIRFLYPPDRKNQVARQMIALKNALDYFEAHVGAYPWPYLTLVDPPVKGSFSGGMEYTTLFTSTSFFGIPEYLRIPEMVTIHEFGHAYFMGILASNEFEDPWLDEGVNTYWEGRIMDHFYGSESGLINHSLLKISDRSQARMSYVYSESRHATSNVAFSWKYPAGTYSMMSYFKAGVILQTLEGIIGEEMMDKIFREYYKKWSFRHPSAKDFIATANEVVAGNPGNMYGPDLNWFFNQTLYGTDVCDYKVIGFTSRKVSGSDSLYLSAIDLQRDGGIMLPVDVLVHFDNGDEIKESWDGISRTKEFKYTRDSKITWVKIDPDFKIRMDVNYINNSFTNDPDLVPVRRLRNKLISMLQFFINFISI
ncbi:MAG TPA: M1 family metallopeptidase [Bacteroidales bacterium]|nr:M1 family metallopeptidase [Bacteroidales bacterium]